MRGLLMILCVLQVVLSTLGCCDSKTKDPQCCDTWKLVYENNANGGTISGNRYALLAAILAGSRVRVSWNNYLTEADGIFVSGVHAHAELLQHVSKASWKSFQDDAYWYWTMVSTTGFVQNIRYNVGAHTSRGVSTGTIATKWYIKSSYCQNNAIYANSRSGQGTTGKLQDLKNAVAAGYEIRAVTNKYYSFPLQNIAYDGTKVAGQFLDHVSKTESGKNLVFQNNAYWWFTIISTKGKRDMSRWSVGSHVDRGHTSDTVSTEWFQDPCWELVYSHDTTGRAKDGSLKALILAIQSGRRIRIQLPTLSHYTAEADNLSIRKGHVTAQALKHVSKASLETFQDNAYWYWLMVSTTGRMRETRYNVGSHVHRATTKSKRPVKWFADTRPWKLAFIHNSLGHDIHGSRSTVVDAVRRGASVRLVQADGAYAFSGQNLVVNGVEVAAQTLNHVSMKTASDNIHEMEIQPNAYWWFTIVTTAGDRDMSRWTVGEHQSRGHTQDRVGLKWFVQE